MRLMTGEKIIRYARPNRHYVALVEGGTPTERYYYVFTQQSISGDEEPFESEYECDDIHEATKVFDREVQDFHNIANYEAQAGYDDAHGTDNGYPLHHYLASEY